MQTKTWRMKEGFLIGGCLILIGLALQWSVGPVVWEALAWPSNGMVLTGFLLMLITMFLLRKKIYAFQFISTCQAAIPALVYAVALTILMGVTPQEAHGTGLNNMLACWPFVLIYTYIDLILGQIILRRTANCQLSIVNLKKDIPFLLLHLGLFLTLTTATLGHADLQRVKMMTATGVPERRALTPDGMVKNMPMSIELKRFIMETYDDGTPKRFASHLLIQTETGRKIETLVDVNKPYEVDGWSIYQLDYDTRMDPQHPLSILELVSDPWLPIVYAGIYLMLAGALLLLTYTHWSHKRWWPIATVVLVALACVSHFMPIIRATQLVPALQSPWFTPHILVYILCYSLFGAVALLALWTLIRGKQSAIRSHHLDNLVFVGLMFMTFGMLFGAFWAKESWGDYWSWDPKETWAAITWFAYLVYIHYRQLPHHHERLSRWMLIISFLLLQMCWWGIKYLPSAQKTSVHVYTMNE